MRRLLSIAAIKHAVANGYDVRCDGGGYKVTRDSLGQFLITHVATDYCVGLHGCAGTKYADKLNGRDFYVHSQASPKCGAALFADVNAEVDRWLARVAKQARKVPAGRILCDADRALAVHWYAHNGYSLQTIADHFKVDVETLKSEIKS